MDKEKLISLRKVIKYSVARPYFDEFAAVNLDSAFGKFKQSKDWEKPVKSESVQVGHIDGGVICRALWNEMSYNPKRFGKVSPFLHNGKENIYRFCDKPVPETTPAFELVETLRAKLVDFMTLNALPNGQWNDVVKAYNGLVYTTYVNGHSDNTYKKLTLLREMIHLIASQNMKDWKLKAYRTEMIKVIETRHPNGIRFNTPFVAKPIVQEQKTVIEQDDFCNEGEEERIKYEMDEIWRKTNKQISVEEYKNIEFEQYNEESVNIDMLKNKKMGKGR